ncbi:MAG: hypothetical protein LBM74_09785 [Oscillospiraceae bacterium]|jgi:hypothetical protein|nr:hypothetical protein [Oscillospiraceae bacterium]
MRRTCRTLALIALIVSLALPACAEDSRALMLDYEPLPLDAPPASAQTEALPIACAPDAFADLLLENPNDPLLQPLWEAIFFTPSADNQQIAIDLPGGGGITFPCTEEFLTRHSFAEAGAELVCFGSRGYCSYAFLFLQTDGAWQLADCLYNFEDAKLYRSGETAWLAGQGIEDSTQETRRYERWYNLRTRAIDVSYVTEAFVNAGEHHPDLYQQRMQSTASFGGDALKIVQYLGLIQWQNYYTGEDLLVRQRDNLARVTIYRYNPDTYALEQAGIWVYENASPTLLENMNADLFLNGQITE